MPNSSATITAPQDVVTQAPTSDRPADPVGTGKPRSLWSDAWHDLRRNPMFLVSASLIIFLVVIAVFPSLFTSTDPKFCDLAHYNGGRAPGHPFGFDRQGCDIYSRVIYGARASVTVGILVTSGVVIIGGTIGALAAFYGGWLDALLSRVTDVFFAIPLLLGAIVFLQAFPFRNIWTVVAAIMLLGWPSMARIMRGSVISVKESDFVTAARALGASDMRILTRHILPNAVAPVIVVATISLGLFNDARGNLVLPRHRASLVHGLLGWGHQRRPVVASIRPTRAALPLSGAVDHRARLHVARRRGS